MVKVVECENHCKYIIGGKADLCVCERCGRIKAIRNKDGFWENLY